MARNDKLIIRHPQPKPQDDWFMLDRWTPAVMHTVAVHYREVVERGVVVGRMYRAICRCGWRAIEYHAPTVERCPVGDALHERAKRLNRGERVVWFDAASEPRHSPSDV